MSFSLSPMQIKSIQESTARQNLWCGSVRSGKTFSSILRFIGLCKSLPPGDALICGVSRETIQRNVINLLCDLTGCPLPSSKSSHFKLMGRLIHLVGAPDESAVRRIKGSTLVLAYIDELTDIPEPFYTMILSRLSIDQAKLIATTNPEGPQHWLKKKVIDDETINFKMFQFSLDDNPSLPDSYKEEIKKEYSGVWYERYIMGQWSRAEGLCFDAFDPNVHVVDSIKRPPGYKIAGIDYGTTNPTSCHLLDVRTNMWPQIYVEKEYYFDPEKTGYSKTDAELADDIYDFLKLHEIETVYVDPAAASFKLELTRKGLPVANANNDVLQRIKVGNKFFHQVNIVINSGCKNLIDQLQSYSWDKKASERGEDKPVKKDDHACFVAGTLIQTDEGIKPIERIELNNKVLTRFGYQNILKIHNYEKEVIELDLFGKTILCTPDHLFFTEKGWKKSEDLTQSDMVFIYKGKNTCPKKLDSMELLTEDTPNQSTLPIENILNQGYQIVKKDMDISIEMFGNTIMERYPKDTIFITLTGIPQTMSFAISNVFQLMTIYPNMEEIIQKIGTNSKSYIWKELEQKQQNGTDQKMVGNGIEKMEKKSGNYETRPNKIVSIAEDSTNPDAIESLSFVAINVPLQTEENLVLMMRKEIVNDVIKSLSLTNTVKPNSVEKVAQKRISGKQKVYDITVENHHEYFAEGLLVHNCDSFGYCLYTRFPNGELEDFYDQEMLDKLYNEAMRELNAI